MISPLIELLKSYDEAYETGTPAVSDAEYDRMKEEVRGKYPNDPYFKTVGAPVVVGRKVQLGHTIGSLDKKNVGNIMEWLEQYRRVIISEKLDGSGIYVTYNKGKLVSAATRGDGSVGQDITEKARLFLPESIPYTGRLVVRGEAMLLGNDHIKLGFKNKRNGVAGLLNRMDYYHDDVKCIVAFMHEVIEPDVKRGEMFHLLKDQGFLVSRNEMFFTKDLTENGLVELLQGFRANSECEMDGLVIADADGYREDVYYPENVVAFKVNQMAVRTKVVDVEWNVGRTGRVIPTVLIEPVEIDGTTVSRATGFNAKFIMDNNIVAGRTVGVCKRGDIIPHIEYVED